MIFAATAAHRGRQRHAAVVADRAPAAQARPDLERRCLFEERMEHPGRSGGDLEIKGIKTHGRHMGSLCSKSKIRR